MTVSAASILAGVPLPLASVTLETAGGVVSMVMVRLPLELEMFPAASVAFAVMVWAPLERVEVVIE